MRKGVINSAIKQHLLSNNPLTDAQFVFYQVHSAPNLITALVQTWAKELNARGEGIAVYLQHVDFSSSRSQLITTFSRATKD
eukprot:g40975.t1